MTNYDDLLNDYKDILSDDELELETPSTPTPTIDEAVKALRAQEEVRSSVALLHGLSGLVADDLSKISPVWAALPPNYRRTVMRDLIKFSELNIEMDYRTFGIAGMDDPDPGVREAAIELLWEDESLEVMTLLIKVVRHDIEPEVRAAAATGLGRYILLGELGDLPEDETAHAQTAVITMLQDPNESVAAQRRALEAIANSSHPIVKTAIDEAYHGTNHEMRVSAVFAMGRSCDSRWHDIVLEEVESTDPELCFEAVRAAGELEIVEAVPKLGRLVLDDDREIVEAAVWSLGEIGGKESVRILEALAEKAEEEEDEGLIDAVEDALGNATLADGLFGDLDVDDLV